MSNLLNNNGKKKLLNRGTTPIPEQQFNLNDVTEDAPVKKVEETKESVSSKKKDVADNTSLRVKKQTRNRLKALIHYGRADNVDSLIEMLLEEYLETNLKKEERKTYDLILKLITDREK